MFGLSKRMRPAGLTKLLSVPWGVCVLWQGHLWVEVPCRLEISHYTADHSTDFRLHMENYGFKSHPGAPCAFPHRCSAVFCANLSSWSWSCCISSFTLEFVSPSLHMLLPHIWWAQTTPAVLQEDTGQCPSWGQFHFWKMFRLYDDGSKSASLISMWLGTDGRQLSSLLARTKQSMPVRKKASIIFMLSGKMWTSLIPALPWEQLCTAPCSASHWL